MVNGNLVSLMDSENLTISMGVHIRAIGLIIKDRDMDNTRVELEQNIQDFGKMTKCMDLEFKIGLMVHNLVESIHNQQEMEKGAINGQINQNMMECGNKTK